MTFRLQCAAVALAMLLAPHRAGSSASESGSAAVTLDATGDILLGRNIGQHIDLQPAGYPFTRVAGLFHRADIVTANLECALSNRDFAVSHRFLLRAPPKRASLLKSGGITILNLANNHSMDCGSEGLQDTEAALRAQRLGWYGVGECEVLNVRGVKVAFVGFCDFPPTPSEREPTGAAIAYASDASVKRAVANATTRADCVVAVFHWGTELSDKENPRQVHLAHVAVLAGAALVLGHHPHVRQPIRWYRPPGRRRPALIAFSLGNFVFDARTAPERHGTILSCRLDRDGVIDAQTISVELVHGAPRPGAVSAVPAAAK